MRDFLSTISLKRIFSFFTIATIGLLFIVIFFATKQYFLFQHCEKLVDSSQHLLFQFTGIKEHINETLLSKKQLNTPEINKEIQGLDTQLQHILDDILIPEEFKLNFVSQLDLVNITVALRNLQSNPEETNPSLLISISSQLRKIDSKLNSFHQLISRYTQTQLNSLHKAYVGLLSVVIALVSLMLLIINRYITSPIIHYCKTISPDDKAPITLFSLHKTIETLGASQVTTVNPENTKDTQELTRLYRYSSIGHLLRGLSHELTNLSNGAINYTQAILDLSDDFNLDEDSKQLVKKLFLEEKRMSQLLTNMISFTSGSAQGQAKTQTMDDLIEDITILVQSTFKNEQIDLKININQPAFILKNHVSDLQLVILSAMQNSRIALNKKFPSQQSLPENGNKEIIINHLEDNENNNTIIIEITDNGANHITRSSEDENEATTPWHNMNFCKEFLQTFGGNLSLSRGADDTNICLIRVPLTENK